jgi:ferredoxin
MRVYVDANECQGHTLCNMMLPQVFSLRDEDGHSYVEDEVVPPDLEPSVRKAALACPEGAIKVVG